MGRWGRGQGLGNCEVRRDGVCRRRMLLPTTISPSHLNLCSDKMIWRDASLLLQVISALSQLIQLSKNLFPTTSCHQGQITSRMSIQRLQKRQDRMQLLEEQQLQNDWKRDNATERRWVKRTVGCSVHQIIHPS